MARSQAAWAARLERRARKAAKAPVLTLRKVMKVSRATTGDDVIEMVPTAALIRHARTEAGLEQWDVFTALRVPGATWRAFEKGERPMPRATWERFQAWLRGRA